MSFAAKGKAVRKKKNLKFQEQQPLTPPYKNYLQTVPGPLKRKGIKSHELILAEQLRKDLENMKSNARDENAKALYLENFQ